MEKFSVTLKGKALGVEVPETTVVEAENEQEAENKAKNKSVLEQPELDKIEKLSFLKK